jgi:hypothetical protein
MTKSVSLYKRRDAIHVSASHKTQAGFWIDDDGVVTLVSPQPASVWDAVKSALALSREGVPTPRSSVDLTVPLLTAAGVASWSTFVKAAQYVGIRQDGDMIKITPYKNLGSKEGFAPIQDKAVSLLSGDSGLGVALVRALEVAN